MKKAFKLGLVLSIVIFSQCNHISQSDQTELNAIAESYVKLVLKIGMYDSDYVDAYYGPEEWKPSALTEDSSEVFPYPELKSEVDDLISRLGNLNPKRYDSTWKSRYDFLDKQLLAVRTEVELLAGNKMTFDEESKSLYDAVVPEYNMADFDRSISAIDTLLPGEGDIFQRRKAFNKQFEVDSDRIDTLFTTSLSECRKRTISQIQLPSNENFKIEYVKDKPWGAYNWYQGGYQSLLQVNVSNPLTIFSPLSYASHEGYPGHHANYSLLDKNLYHDRKWVEFSVVLLYSPESLIAEGIACYAQEMLFTKEDEIKYVKNILCPLAGIDTSQIDLHYLISDRLKPLSGATIYIAREYLDGKCGADEAIAFLEKYLNIQDDDAKSFLEFIKQYRSYIVNYELGYQLVKNYIEKTDDPKERWERFYDLLSMPRTASSLAQ